MAELASLDHAMTAHIDTSEDENLRVCLQALALAEDKARQLAFARGDLRWLKLSKLAGDLNEAGKQVAQSSTFIM